MPRTSQNLSDPHLLEAALEGLLLQKQRIDAQIKEVKTLLGRKRGVAVQTVEPARTARRRSLSESARKRIAAAQKKRWAEYRKQRPKAE